MKLFLLSGERSGDRHGAGLIEELRARHPDISFHGLGGAEMHALCPDIPDWVEEARGYCDRSKGFRRSDWSRS